MTPPTLTEIADRYCRACARGDAKEAERTALEWTAQTTGKTPQELDDLAGENGGYRHFLARMILASRTGAPRVKRGE